MDNRDSNINDNNAKNIKNNLKPRGDHISQKIDFSVVKGMKLFPLFDRREDNYIYEKKFYNDLPKDLVFPKAFNLNSNINNFAKFDMMTMLFGLKKSQDLLTNPRLNTNIHLDFISNSLHLIFPENKLEFKNKTNKLKDSKSEENKQLASFKQEILDIIDSKDESEMKEKEVNPRCDDAFYLRNTMLLSGYLNINKKISSKKDAANIANENREKNKHNTKSQHEEYIKSLEKTFEESEKIHDGLAHPTKKGVTAKKVYRVFPFFEFDENKFSQIIFPEDPSAGASKDKLNESNTKQGEISNEDLNNIVENEKFILKSKESNSNNGNSNQLFTLYKNEMEDQQEAERIQEEIGYNDFIKSKISYYNFEREYIGTIQNKEEELFNRYLIFINKANKTAKILPVHTKLFLKKHKTSDWPAGQNQDIDNDEDYNKFLNKKRERDIAIVPKNIDVEEIKNRNNSFHNSGFIKQFSGKVDKIQNIELERIAKTRKRTESQPNEEGGEDDELFGNEFNSDSNEHSEKDYEDENNNNNDIKQEDFNKDYEEENNYESGYSSS